MKTIKLTAKDFKDGEYTGKHDLSNIDGNLEFAADIGVISLKSINVTGYILSNAGTYIKAGWGIVSFLSISCKLELSAKLRIFAGVCNWRKISQDDEKIICGKLVSGEVAFGTLEETGIDAPVDTCDGKTVEIEGIKYKLVKE